MQFALKIIASFILIRALNGGKFFVNTEEGEYKRRRKKKSSPSPCLDFSYSNATELFTPFKKSTTLTNMLLRPPHCSFAITPMMMMMMMLRVVEKSERKKVE
jgi:hypothetical protein